jgi:hypothetical protein
MNPLLTLLQSTPGTAITSGYVLCIIPLAIVVVGFIVAARSTDKTATAKYLRILPSKSDKS